MDHKSQGTGGRVDNRLDSLELVSECTESERIVQRSESQHVFQASNAIDNNVYDESTNSLQAESSRVLAEPIFEEEEENSRSEQKERELNREQRRYALQELVDTEKSYVQGLGEVVEGYIEMIRRGSVEVPKDLKKGKLRFVFGNIEEIYEFHRDNFLPRLESCLEDPEQLGRIFKQFERRMSMYVNYHRNKPYSEYIASKYDEIFFAKLQQELGHSLTLSDYLIKPVHRLMMYKLLLTSILKKTKKAGITEGVEDLEDAVKLMHALPQMSNDMLEIGRIQGFDDKLGSKEKLLHQGQMLVLDMSPGSRGMVSSRFRFKQRRVFLFEQIIIFCAMVDGRTKFSKPTFYLKHSLPLNKTKLHHEGMEPLQFLLTTKSDLEEGETFVLQAPSAEDRQEWIERIGKVLKVQEVLVIALGSPIAYHEGLAIESPSPGISENPLPPQLMLRIISVKKKSRKKSVSLSGNERERDDDSPNTERNGADSGDGSGPATPSATRKTFLPDLRNAFHSLKRMLSDKEHSHI